MFHRSIKLPKSQSIFLFGARGTGKSTLLRSLFGPDKALYLDLLDPELETRLHEKPSLLRSLIANSGFTTVVIDEVQKAAKLLDIVHALIENSPQKLTFILTGSSARKLKRGGANLLAGRAFLYHLFPLTHTEIGTSFSLDDALTFGTLPKIFAFGSDDESKFAFLRTYANTYLKEEILAEQLIRKVDPFRDFLKIASTNNGKIINSSNIAKDCGVDVKTVQSYYQILDDTLLGFFIPGFHTSVRRQVRTSPKFYFFDVGVARGLANTLRMRPVQHTSYYGDLFEQYLVCEIFRRNVYEAADFELSYLATADGAEIDLIIKRPGGEMCLVEIKSTDKVDERHAKGLLAFANDFPKAELLLLSQDNIPQKFSRVQALPWQMGIEHLFSVPRA